MRIKVCKIRLSDDYLVADQKNLDRLLQELNVVKFESAFVEGEINYWSVILYYEEPKVHLNDGKPEKYSIENDAELNLNESQLLESLKKWRSEKSVDNKIPAYFIATNKELSSIAKFKPAKKEELREIKGFGKHKIENYGAEIIKIIETV